jgi:S-adenosylmethionine synthetase
VDELKINQAVRELFDLTPNGIIGSLNLRRGIFSPTSAYGHFGRPGSADRFTWEQLDRVDDIKSALGL